MLIDRRRLLELTGFAAAESATGSVAAVGGLGGQVAPAAVISDELKQKRRRERLKALTERMLRKAKFRLERALKMGEAGPPPPPGQQLAPHDGRAGLRVALLEVSPSEPVSDRRLDAAADCRSIQDQQSCGSGGRGVGRPGRSQSPAASCSSHARKEIATSNVGGLSVASAIQSPGTREPVCVRITRWGDAGCHKVPLLRPSAAPPRCPEDAIGSADR